MKASSILKIARAASAFLLFPIVGTLQAAPVINEVVSTHPAATGVPTGFRAAIEVYSGATAFAANQYHVVVVGGDEGRNSNVGSIIMAYPLPAMAADTYYCMSTRNIGSGTRTILLVEGYTGPVSGGITDDLAITCNPPSAGNCRQIADLIPTGTANAQLTYILPGILTGVLPWSTAVDGLATWDGGKNDITFESTTTSGVNAVSVRLDPNFDNFNVWVQGASRVDNGVDTNSVADWIRNSPDGAGLASPYPDFAINNPSLTTPATICYDNDSVPLPPIAANDVVSVVEGAGNVVVVDFPANDSDPNLDLFTVSTFSQGTYGTVVHNTNGTPADASDDTFTYTYTAAAPIEATVDTFTYSLTDGLLTSANATVTVNITLINDNMPTSVNATVTTLEDTDRTFVAASDFAFTDVDVSEGDGFAGVRILTLPVDGTLYLDLDLDGILDGGEAVAAPSLITIAQVTSGLFKFKPDLNESGNPYTTFTFAVVDDGITPASLESISHTITVDVTPQNDCPTAANDAIVTTEDATASGIAPGVLTNDSDPDSVITVSAVNGNAPAVGNPFVLPSGAIITLNADGSYTYNPNGAFESLASGDIGTDSFTYTVTDGTCTANATVNVTINGLNDCPVATNDTGSTDEDTTLLVPASGALSNDTDVDVGASRIVTEVNGNAADVGNPIVVGLGALLTLNADGSYSLNPNGAYEDLDQGATALVSFMYTMSDGTCTATATVDVTINGVNDCPTGTDDTGLTDEDTTLMVPANGLLGNDTDVDASSLLSITAVNGVPGNVGTPINVGLGALLTVNGNGSYTLNPNSAYEALDAGDTDTITFTYTVSDGLCSDEASVTITINGLNDCPVANDDVGAVNENASLSVPAAGVLANDVDLDASASLSVSEVNGSGANVGMQITLASGALLTVNADGSYLYDPNGAFNSLNALDTTTDSFTYRVTDGTCSDTATVTITITGVNSCPVANDDVGSLNEDDTLSVTSPGLRGNDTDADSAASLSVFAVNGNQADVGVPVSVGLGALVTVNANGSYTFDSNGAYNQLNAGDNVLVTFTYTITDGACTDDATVSITINGQNDCPTAVADAATTNENSALLVAANGVLGNDLDPDSLASLAVTEINGNPASVGVQITLASGALLTANADGSYSYDPNGQYEYLDDGDSTADSFQYTVSDGTCTSSTTVTVTITGVNDCPVAVADADTTDKLTILNVPAAGVLTNDMDPDDVLAVSEVQGSPANVGNPVTLPSGAIVTLNADGSFSYNPNGAFAALPSNGSQDDSFTYTATDGTCSSSTTVTITVTGVNNCPVANNDANATTEDASVTANAPGVLGNDTDIDPVDTLVVTALNGNSGALGVPTALASGALVTLNVNGSYTYNPNGSFEDLDDGDVTTDSFQYTVSDGMCPVTASVTITINGLNDCPIAIDDNGSTNEDTVLSVAAAGLLLNDTDADADALLTVSAVEGVGANVGNAISVGLGALLTVNANGSYSLNPNGAYDHLDLGDSAFITFTYTTSDGVCSDDATVTITINGVNDCPVGVDDTGSTNENTLLSVAANGLLANDTDADAGATLSVSAVNGVPANVGNAISVGLGALLTVNADGSYSLDPNSAYEALAEGATDTITFTYTVSDGTCSDDATVVITIVGVNDCPVAVDDTGSTDENTTLSVAAAGLLSNDTDVDVGASFAVTQVNGVSGNVGIAIPVGLGALLTVNSDGSYTLDPNGAYESLAQGDTALINFSYTMSDGLCSDDGTVTITINGVNDCPVATDDSGTTDEDTVLNVSAAGLLGNDSDVDSGASLAVNEVNGIAGNVGNAISVGLGALLTVNADGSYMLNPNGAYENLAQGETATINFMYTVTDGLCSVTANVTITIDGVNDCPIAGDDAGSTDEDSILSVPATGLLGNDFDVDNGATSMITAVNGVPGNVGSPISVGLGALLTVNADGSYTLNPNNAYEALDAGDTDSIIFTYTMSDGLCSDDATVTITINGLNDCPVANADTSSTDENTPITVAAMGVLTNDTDADNSAALTVTAVEGNLANVGVATNVSGALITLNADGSYTFDPNSAFENLNLGDAPTVVINYTVSDGTCTSNTTLTITVNGVNDCPVAVDDAYATDENTALNEAAPGLLANDTDVDNATLNTVVVAITSTNGAAVTINADGSFSYDPNVSATLQALGDGAILVDTFTYDVTDGACTVTATVSVTVTGVNEPPVANDDSYTTDEDAIFNVPAPGILGNDSDADLDPITITTTSPITTAQGATVTLNADGSFTYDPTGSMSLQMLPACDTALDTFSYSITDGSASDSATVTFTVNGLNDLPVAGAIRKTTVFANGLWSPFNGKPAMEPDVNMGDYWQPIVIPIEDLDSPFIFDPLNLSLCPPNDPIPAITVTEGMGKQPAGMQIMINPPNFGPISSSNYDASRGYWTFNVLIPEGTTATTATVPLEISDGFGTVTITYILTIRPTPRFPIAREMPRYYSEGIAFKDFVTGSPLSRNVASLPATTPITVNWWVAYSVYRESVNDLAFAAEDWRAYFINYFGTENIANDQVYWTPTRFFTNETKELQTYLLSDGDDNPGLEESRCFTGVAVRGGLSFYYYGHREIDPLPTMDYSDWRVAAFGVDSGSLTADPAADFNSDGVPNEVAYALGLDPLYNLAGVTVTPTANPNEWMIEGLPLDIVSSMTTILSNGENWKQINYQRNPEATGVTFALLYTEDNSVASPVWSIAPEGHANVTNARFGLHLYDQRVLLTDQMWQLFESWKVNARVKDITNKVEELRVRFTYGTNHYILVP